MKKKRVLRLHGVLVVAEPRQDGCYEFIECRKRL